MKHLLFMVAIVVIWPCIGLSQTTKSDLESAAGIWVIDEEKSELTFAIENFYMANVKGVFGHLIGTIDIQNPLKNSKVNLKIEISSLETGNDKRDIHVKEEEFFDYLKFPFAQYNGTSIVPAGDKKNPYTLIGNLEIKQFKKPIEVPFNHSMSSDGKLLVVVGKTQVAKADFGLDDWKGVGVGETATVTFKVVARKK